MPTNYPFAAIVGQEPMKTALLLNAVSPTLSGVLIQGEKGTAKTTAVRSLAELLPGGRKVVELPVSATEDRVVGTLDFEAALHEGEKRFEPGILAEADGNILYIDEVNLLEDHIVDVLLDAAATGVNTVEREGISHTHPARFVLVGTMNPEEGDLRPQILDRFGLSVKIESETDPAVRAEIVRRRLRFEQDPEAFAAEWEPEQQKLREQIVRSRELLPQVQLGEEALDLAVRICIETGTEGHRADITLCKAAEALAAWNGRTEVDKQDVVDAAALCLYHRMRRKPFEEPVLDMDKIRALADGSADDPKDGGNDDAGDDQSH